MEPDEVSMRQKEGSVPAEKRQQEDRPWPVAKKSLCGYLYKVTSFFLRLLRSFGLSLSLSGGSLSLLCFFLAYGTLDFILHVGKFLLIFFLQFIFHK